MKKRIKRILLFILNTLLPPRCLICQTIVCDTNGLCADCFAKVHFLTDQSCPVCGRPYTFPVQKGENLICGKCLMNPPHFKYLKAVFAYDQFSRNLILPFKHANRTEVVPYLSRLMFMRGRDLLSECDMIIAVPLHWKRMLKRKYNQSALLAVQLSKRSGKPFVNDELVRVKNTASQGHKTHQERLENVKDAFQVRHSQSIQGKKIVLVDDVSTTGATFNECARVLRQAGAVQVTALCVARVCRFE